MTGSVIRVVVMLLVALAAAASVARAQQTASATRIGYLATGLSSPRQVLEDALRERGWVPGKNLVIEYRYAGDSFDRFPALAAESAFPAMMQARADAVLIQLDPSFSRHLGRLAELAIRHRLPSMCGALYVPAGGLMSYSVSRVDTIRQVAVPPALPLQAREIIE